MNSGSRFRAVAGALGGEARVFSVIVLAALIGAVAALTCGAAPVAASIPGPAVGEPQGVPASTAQPVTLVLTLKTDGAGLKRQALASSTPGSPSYRHYVPIATISRRFGASRAARRRVLSYLRAEGARAVRIDATGLFAQATLSLGRAEALFATPVMTFRSADGRPFIASTARVRIPRALAGSVEAVLGLDTRPVLTGSAASPPPAEFAFTRSAPAQQPSSEAARTGTTSGCAAGVAAGEVNNDPSTGAFTPNQYLSAYNYDVVHGAGLQGQGQRVALIEADGVKASDVTAFANCFGFSSPPIHQFAVGGLKKRPPGLEAILDTEVLDAAAPGLRSIDVYETKPDLADTIRAFTAPLQKPGATPSVISISLGLCEAQAKAAVGLNGPKGLKTADLALAAAVESGITVVSASGDAGSAGCQRPNGAPIDRLGVLYPASSWWSTTVGGTNLFLGGDNAIADEVVWNDAALHLGAGGGGISSLLTRPPDQKGLVGANHRAVPDVSMLADVMPGYALYCTAPGCRGLAAGNPWIRAGGTSAAAPLFAGAMALIDQELRAQNVAPIGDIDSLLYVIGKTPERQLVFNDVTRIGNDIGPFIRGSGGHLLGCCSATTGYDDASGWGSVNVAALEQIIQALAPMLPASTLGRVGFSLPPRQHPVKTGSLLARVNCSKSCRVLAEVVLQIGSGKPIDLMSRIYRLKLGGSKRIQFKFTPAELRRLVSGLKEHKQINGVGFGILTDEHQAFVKYSPPHEFQITG